MQIIAHRGASFDAPENTMLAFALAKEQGAHAIEIDLQETADLEVVIFHDWSLEKLCGQRGAIRRMRLEEVRGLRVGGEPIPTLEEVIASDDRPRGLVLELKSERWNDVRVAALAAKVIRRTRALERGPLIVSSFNPFSLMTLRRLAPEVPRALLGASRMAFPIRGLWGRPAVAPVELHVDARMATPRFLARHHRRGRRVIAWTVNEPDLAREVRDRGVDGVITDVPGVLRDALG